MYKIVFNKTRGKWELIRKGNPEVIIMAAPTIEECREVEKLIKRGENG